MKNTHIIAITGIVAVTILAISYTAEVTPERNNSQSKVVSGQLRHNEERRAEVTSDEDPFSESNDVGIEESHMQRSEARQIATSGGPNPRIMIKYFEGGSTTEELDFDWIVTPFENKLSEDE